MNAERSFLRVSLNMKERSVFTAQFCGTRAGAVWPDCEIFGEKNKLVTDTKIFNIAKSEPHNDEVRAFYEAVTQRRKSPVPLHETAQVIAILEGLYKSAELGREIRVT